MSTLLSLSTLRAATRAIAAARREASTLSIATGDERGAGTHAKVSVTLLSPDGARGAKTVLSRGTQGFDRDSVRTFELPASALPPGGTVGSVTLGHDSTGLGSGWCVLALLLLLLYTTAHPTATTTPPPPGTSRPSP